MAPLPQLTPGMVFARDFRVLRHLSAGGMGAVYVVEQISTQRQRALKIMLPDLVREPKARERFMQEATVSARIRSDHVVEVVGAGVDDDTGTPWIAMELLEGEDLSSVMQRRGALPPVEVMEIYRQLCHGLGSAHRSGLVHRDLKPENIFMATARREGVSFTVKVLDFGIAKVVGESRTSAASTSAIGSPLWMSPEQAEQGLIRPATDVWALGLIAFHLLTGVYYWRTANTDNVVIAAILKEVFIDALEPASVRAYAYGRNAMIPPGFDAWFARCVCRDPSQRFNDASEALTALLSVLGGAAGITPNAPTYPGPAVPQAYTPPNPVVMHTPAGYAAPPNVTPSGPSPYGTQGWNPVLTHTGSPSLPYTAYAAPPHTNAPSRNTTIIAASLAAVVILVGGLVAAMFVLRAPGPAHNPPDASVPSLIPPQVFRGPQCRGTGTRTDVNGLAGVSALASGRYHGCAALTDGTVRCWGWNQLGQLGDGTSEDQYVPTTVPGLGGVTQVGAGQGLSCALINNGSVYCWGLSAMGVRRQPYLVGGLSAATQLSVGEDFACARRADGAVYCWGMNSSAQLGDGSDRSRLGAEMVPGLAGVAQVAAGGGHACALLVDGSVWCWGRQEHGQLGNGRRAREPLQRPVAVSGIAGVVQITAGENHTCALLNDGTARCWGWNEMGQLGIGAEGNQAVPMMVQGLTGLARITAGYHHTCALQRDGALWCWGENYTCQLGAGGIQGPMRPFRIEAPGAVIEVAPGANHTCVRTRTGSVRCWGFNIYGQLANGTTSRQPDLDTIQNH
jgi:serine/threonine protein kinase/alpha-tubulin suppressor-like RCC1 family protein